MGPVLLMLVMGYMSGTSLDGVDVALIETDGERIEAFGSTAMTPFTDAQRVSIEQATRDALAWNGYGAMPSSFDTASTVIERVHIEAGERLMAEAGRRPDLIGFHGQTLLHRPERGLSVQIGDPQMLADVLGVPVVAQMRQDDLQAGGQGAPLVPVYHAALAEYLGIARPVAFLNIGGVANLTWIGADRSLIAFDTGPGNGLIDQLVQSRGAGRYDDGGRFAAAGCVATDILARLLTHDYFQGEGARSLDRYDFPLDWVAACSIEDAAATLTAFTAEAVALAARTLPAPPELWIVCGGGGHNPVLMAALRDRLGGCRTADEIGLRSDFIEAEAMAFLAARSLHGLPLTFPGTTGVVEPLTGGRLWRPRNNTKI
ncbi:MULTISPECIES: anhydro-N-acetylmuramic acid kinase [unclassified Sphingomonas]|uniref:anhydro-N-acetylmuramic acid kinase n=1 Tax=unclassified Sphingomonas TaxID=196159 RepID=UPI0028555D39|nr:MULTISPECIES: anhydro-N-acetylmuramic acid kinase [unclassified Sphingomonas]MDR6116206.1 anhydro-N-acetylmuramic acid kinase [Sphingomonas sp. SORGH_AS_0789]MDR6150119.1 anhydro-N-acetylmuramic acid kinase [Sphingomonas sp. SORGH_AS_0742]